MPFGEKGAAMKNLAAAMLLTGFSFLTACGANQTGYAGSGQSSDAMSEADVQTSAAESDAAASDINWSN